MHTADKRGKQVQVPIPRQTDYEDENNFKEVKLSLQHGDDSLMNSSTGQLPMVEVNEMQIQKATGLTNRSLGSSPTDQYSRRKHRHSDRPLPDRLQQNNKDIAPHLIKGEVPSPGQTSGTQSLKHDAQRSDASSSKRSSMLINYKNQLKVQIHADHREAERPKSKQRVISSNVVFRQRNMISSDSID